MGFLFGGVSSKEKRLASKKTRSIDRPIKENDYTQPPLASYLLWLRGVGREDNTEMELSQVKVTRPSGLYLCVTGKRSRGVHVYS